MKTSKETTEKTTKKYWAFISYRHADNLEQDRDWASWLHKSIETYDVPAELIGTKNDRGDIIPERIYPVFRDEESLPADADLANSITNALDNSNFLVALCSPRAVESKYVAQEIEHFKTTGKGNRIIAGIIAGEPDHPENECFPEPIREVVNQDGKLSEPIAADFRRPDGKQGFTSAEAYKKELLKTLSKKEAAKKAGRYDERLHLMKLKIIAGILGKPLETIRNRDKAYQLQKAKKRHRILTTVIASVSILAIVAIIMGIFAITQKNLAENNEKLAVKNEKKANLSAKAEADALDLSKDKTLTLIQDKINSAVSNDDPSEILSTCLDAIEIRSDDITSNLLVKHSLLVQKVHIPQYSYKLTNLLDIISIPETNIIYLNRMFSSHLLNQGKTKKITDLIDKQSSSAYSIAENKIYIQQTLPNGVESVYKSQIKTLTIKIKEGDKDSIDFITEEVREININGATPKWAHSKNYSAAFYLNMQNLESVSTYFSNMTNSKKSSLHVFDHQGILKHDLTETLFSEKGVTDIEKLFWGPNGNNLIIICNNGQIYCWDCANNKLQFKSKISKIKGIKISPHCNFLSVWSETRLALFNLDGENAQYIWSLSNQASGSILDVAFSEDENHIHILKNQSYYYPNHSRIVTIHTHTKDSKKLHSYYLRENAKHIERVSENRFLVTTKSGKVFNYSPLTKQFDYSGMQFSGYISNQLINTDNATASNPIALTNDYYYQLSDQNNIQCYNKDNFTKQTLSKKIQSHYCELKSIPNNHWIVLHDVDGRWHQFINTETKEVYPVVLHNDPFSFCYLDKNLIFKTFNKKGFIKHWNYRNEAISIFKSLAGDQGAAEILHDCSFDCKFMTTISISEEGFNMRTNDGSSQEPIHQYLFKIKDPTQTKLPIGILENGYLIDSDKWIFIKIHANKSTTFVYYANNRKHPLEIIPYKMKIFKTNKNTLLNYYGTEGGIYLSVISKTNNQFIQCSLPDSKQYLASNSNRIISNDKKYICVIKGTELTTYNISTPLKPYIESKCQVPLYLEGYVSMSLSPDSRYLAICSSKNVALIDRFTGKPVHPRIKYKGSHFENIHISNDSKTLIITDQEKNIYFYNLSLLCPLLSTAEVTLLTTIRDRFLKTSRKLNNDILRNLRKKYELVYPEHQSCDEKQAINDLKIIDSAKSNYANGQKVRSLGYLLQLPEETVSKAILPHELAHIYKLVKTGKIKNEEALDFTNKTIKPKPGQRLMSPTGIALRWCPAGTYTSGIPFGNPRFAKNYKWTKPARKAGENPQYTIIPNGFWIGETEVTQEQWKSIMNTTIHDLAKEMVEDKTIYKLGTSKGTQLKYNRFPVNSTPDQAVLSVGNQYPIYYISYADASKFIKTINEQAVANNTIPRGWEYRLPTILEWEYACHAQSDDGVSRKNYTILGRCNCPMLDPYAWYAGNSSHNYTQQGRDSSKYVEKQYGGNTNGPRRVKQKKSNAWGIHDMIGNVLEYSLPQNRNTIWKINSPSISDTRTYKYGGGSFDYAPHALSTTHIQNIKSNCKFFKIGLRIVLAKKSKPIEK